AECRHSFSRKTLPEFRRGYRRRRQPERPPRRVVDGPWARDPPRPLRGLGLGAERTESPAGPPPNPGAVPRYAAGQRLRRRRGAVRPRTLHPAALGLLPGEPVTLVGVFASNRESRRVVDSAQTGAFFSTERRESCPRGPVTSGTPPARG